MFSYCSLNQHMNLCAMLWLPVFICLTVFTNFIYAGVPLRKYEALMRQQTQDETGLYNASDYVQILTSANFNELILEQNHSNFVEFYNSYCGHCKRFAPRYKLLAEQLRPWRDILPVNAIDCAAEENNDICREYEVMSYPTLRYIGPGFKPAAGNYGQNITSQDLDEIRRLLVLYLVAENKTLNMTEWPNFNAIEEKDVVSLSTNWSSQQHILIVVFEPKNSTVGIELILNYVRWPNVIIRRIKSLTIASQLKMDASVYKISVIDHNGTVTPYAIETDQISDYIAVVDNLLKIFAVTELSDILVTTDITLLYNSDIKDRNTTLAEVLRAKDIVYYADLEMAIRGILNNEISKVSDIRGERLLALHNFLSVLVRYNPLLANGQEFLKKIHNFAAQHNEKILGKEYEEELHRLETEYYPVFGSEHYIGCIGSRPGLRGFTCSLWQLFHFMTIKAAENKNSDNPLEVLQAMYGYIKYFFGCTDCAEHFQEMASRRKIWNVQTKQEAVLWLWEAHNEVNQRLNKDYTEDPLFPKIQFPSKSTCTFCFNNATQPSLNGEHTWNKTGVFSFLSHMYSYTNISLYGVANTNIFGSSSESLRQKRMLGNVFSDIDMRMGMLLYGFCILMMIVAFKLFVFKGYRRKPYSHDMIGKV